MPKPQKTSPQRETAVAYTAGSDPLAFGPSALTSIAAALASFKAEPPAYDPTAAGDILVAYRPRLTAIAADRLDFPRVDVDAVCRALLAVYSFTQFAPVLAVYKAAAAQEQFDMANLAHLREVTLLLLHAYRLADAAGAFRSTKISAELDAESAEVETRIQKVCEHFFGEHAVIGPVLRQLSPGTGFLNRAYNLLGYADIYEQQHAVVSRDDIHYRDTDLADARRLGAQILAEIGATMTPLAREAFDLLRRTWTLLKPLYFEVQQVGLAGLRYDPLRDERFPSVYTVGRKGQGRKKANAAPSAPAGGAPVVDAPAVK